MKFDTHSVTMRYKENTVVFETSSQIINIGAASFSQPYLMPLNYLYRDQRDMCWLANVAFFPSTTLTSAFQFGQGHSPDPSWANQKGLESKGHTKQVLHQQNSWIGGGGRVSAQGTVHMAAALAGCRMSLVSPQFVDFQFLIRYFHCTRYGQVGIIFIDKLESVQRLACKICTKN